MTPVSLCLNLAPLQTTIASVDSVCTKMTYNTQIVVARMTINWWIFEQNKKTDVFGIKKNFSGESHKYIELILYL
jgi:hypothetical protein